MALFIRDGTMLYALRNDEKLPWVDQNFPVPELYAQASIDNKEQFIFLFVLMPHELPLELHQLYKLPIELSDDLWIPIIQEALEFLFEIHNFHNYLLSWSGIYHVTRTSWKREIKGWIVIYSAIIRRITSTTAFDPLNTAVRRQAGNGRDAQDIQAG
jgi:hypothetical protein